MHDGRIVFPKVQTSCPDTDSTNAFDGRKINLAGNNFGKGHKNERECLSVALCEKRGMITLRDGGMGLPLFKSK